eukprot:m.357940 g.357940  ORF g.357940 m.357940 type:complete len:330 (-) comp17991_c0_seq1:240-1229(-)
MDVDKILRAHKEKSEALLARVNVEREEEYVIDEGNMLGFDSRPISLAHGAVLGEDDEEGQSGDTKNALDISMALTELARENTQLLLNAIWKLPMEKHEEGMYAKLPLPTTKIPREKPVPKPKPKTRWEKFAELKGIQNKKKDRMVYDELSGEYRPRWGYKRANDMSSVPWLEVPDGADPYEDQFEKLAKNKKERTEKNEQQRLRNIATARLKAKGRSVNARTIKKELLQNAISIGRTATASAGVFDNSLPGEDKVVRKGKRAKRQPVVGQEQSEKQRALKQLARMERGPLHIETATGSKSTVSISEPSAKKGKGKGKGRGRGQGKRGRK